MYVFDVPSTDLESLTVFARAADAVVVWGGDEAVRAARRLADPDTQVISWGHKLSFAYEQGPQGVPHPPDGSAPRAAQGDQLRPQFRLQLVEEALPATGPRKAL